MLWLGRKPGAEAALPFFLCFCFFSRGRPPLTSPAPVHWSHASQPFYVTFQKNLNHYNAQAPGNFTISWSAKPNPTSQSDFKLLKSIPDTNTASLTLYVQDIPLPM